MMRIGAVLALSGMSFFAPGVPVGTTLAMIAAGLAGLAAVRFHATAEALVLGGDDTAVSMVRLARFCDDLAVALCVLALLYAISRI